MKKYIMLAISIVAEVFAATMLKLSAGFTEMLPLIGVVIGYGISFGMLGILLKYMPISVAYAIWAGAGTLLTAIIGVVVFGEMFTLLKVVGIVTIVAGIAVLNMSSSAEEASAT